MNFNEELEKIKQNAWRLNSVNSNKFSYLHNQGNQNNDDFINLNGNGFEVAQYISLYSQNDTLTYKIYLLEERYWTEMWRIKKGSCAELERIWKSIMVIAWNYGQVAVKKISDKFEPLGLVSYELDINQNVIKGKGFINNVSFLGANKKPNNTHELNYENSVMGKYNYRGISAVWLYLPFCFNIKKHFISYVNNLVFNTKRIKYTVKNDDIAVINEELNSIFNLKNNIIFQISNTQLTDGLTNEIEVIEKTASDNNMVLRDLNSYIKRWYYMFGRRYSFESDKQERMITNEFAQDELNYILVENEIENELQKIVDRFNEKWNFNAVLEKVSEIVKIKEAKLEEFVAHGDNNEQDNNDKDDDASTAK